MKRVIVDNSLCFIHEPSPQILQFFNDNFIVVDPKTGYVRGQFDIRFAKKVRFFDYSKDKKILGIRSGLWNYIESHYDIDMLVDLFSNYDIEDNRIPLEICSEKIKTILPGQELRDYQMEFFQSLATAPYNNFILEATMAFGKTLVSMALMKAAGLPTLYVTDGMSNTKKNYDVAHACGFSDIGITCTGFSDCDKFFQFSTIDSVYKNNIGMYRMLIIDEVHDAGSETFQQFLRENKFDFRFGMSGTPFTSKVQELKLRQFFGITINARTIDELITDGFLARPHFKIVKIKYPQNFVYTLATYSEALDIEMKGIVENQYRNSKIVEIAMDEAKNGEKVMIMTRFDEHHKRLSELFASHGIDVPVLYGKDSIKKRERVVSDFIAGETNILIASQIFRQGIDIPELSVLILADGMASSYLVKQKYGRVLRMAPGKEKATIYDFIDDQHPMLHRRGVRRRSTYRKIKTAEIS